MGTGQPALQRTQLGVPVLDKFERRSRIGIDFLRDTRQYQVARQIKLAAVRRQLAADQRQQARLTGPIGTTMPIFSARNRLKVACANSTRAPRRRLRFRKLIIRLF